MEESALRIVTIKYIVTVPINSFISGRDYHNVNWNRQIDDDGSDDGNDDGGGGGGGGNAMVCQSARSNASRPLTVAI